jgi:tetraacyldisaccharide 4'-kinase
VISVGNITLGGTGKTPFTIKLAEDIKAMGRNVAVLIRGYGYDESDLLKEKLRDIPVLIGRDRVKNAKRAFSELGSNCVILDDGFQHYRIERDLDIVLIDMTSPFGNKKLFPGGILREPIIRLRDADIAILTKSDMGRDNIASVHNILKQLNSKITIAESFYKPVDLKNVAKNNIAPLSYLINRKVALLAGIANPDYFDWMVRNLGAEIKKRFYYPDHYQYGNGDIAYAVERCSANGVGLLITTEKDAARLKRLRNMPQQIEIFALRIDFRISRNEEAIVDRLHSILSC